MEVITGFFTTIIYQPLFNFLIEIYNIVPDLGISIVIITVIIRVLLLPVSKKSIESQKKMQELQPEIKKIQEKYKKDKQKQGQAIMEFYKEKKVNPAAGCLPLIIQLIILIALYRVFLGVMDFNGSSQLLYSFVENPGHLNEMAFFGLINIMEKSIPLAVIASGFQFWQAKMMMKKQAKDKPKQDTKKKEKNEPNFSEIMQQQMLYMGPFLTFIIGISFPAGLPLYWLITTMFMIGQQYYIIKKDEKKEAEAKPAS
ncbi:MAG: YidC/Oxa1 family membrane protein insertase [Candidatus Moranbacteria bacterium]|nr:YidC/Oxa1 family membrane protein insertase [Candidatus Moranbacteria bacterium]